MEYSECNVNYNVPASPALQLPLLCCVFVAYIDSDAAFDWTPHSNKKLTATTATVDATSMSFRLQLSLLMQFQLQRPRAAIAIAPNGVRSHPVDAILMQHDYG